MVQQHTLDNICGLPKFYLSKKHLKPVSKINMTEGSFYLSLNNKGYISENQSLEEAGCASLVETAEQ